MKTISQRESVDSRGTSTKTRIETTTPVTGINENKNSRGTSTKTRIETTTPVTGINENKNSRGTSTKTRIETEYENYKSEGVGGFKRHIH